MERLTVAVAYHDSRPHPLPGQGPYVAVCNVGPNGSRPAGFAAYDDPDGFPDRNRRYCELSAQRHLELTGDTDLLGLAHYRRIFVTRRSLRTYAPRTYELDRFDWAALDRQGAGEAALIAAVGNRDWCTAPAYDVRWDGHDDLWSQFCAHHPEEMIVAAADAVARVHPGSPSLADHLRRSRRLSFYNMFMARRPLVQQYGNWLWPVLEECSRQIGAIEDPYQARYPGFLAERLMGYWLATALEPAGWRVGDIPIAVVAADGITNGADPAAATPAARPPIDASWSRALARRAPWSARVAVNQVVRHVGARLPR